MIFRGMNRTGVIRDDDIHGYSDGLLDPVRRRQVEQHLVSDSADAERVRTYRRINGGLADLRRSMDDDEAAGQFAALTGDLSKALVRQRQFRRTVGGTALSLFLLASASGAWVLTESGPEKGGQSLQVAAIEAAPSSRLPEGYVEISADSEDEVMIWLSRQVDPDDFAAPDLNSAGFTLSGARVVPTSQGPLVEFHYRDDSKTPLTFSVSGGDVKREHNSLTELSERQMAVYWREGALVYSLIGPMRHSDLTLLADLVAVEAAAKSKKSAAAKDKSSQSAALAAENSGLLLVDSKTEAAASAASSSSGKIEDVSKDADPVKPPPVTVEKIEEPKPL